MITNIINKYPKKIFLIAYSGGLDSTVLLHKMWKIKNDIPDIKIRAIHINHHMHKDSNDWVIHCQSQCQNYSIPIIIENIKIYTKKNNIEEKLRKKRYNLIFHHLVKDEILLTGHHLNDQCETLILSLKRGSGPTGLSSMSIENTFGQKKIVRPLLLFEKKTIKKWAIDNQLKWIEDSSNINITYDRNFIRNKIIPLIEKRWPFFVQNCARTAHICKKENNLLNIFLKKNINYYRNSDNSLNIKKLKMIDKEKCQAIIRYWILSYNILAPSYEIIKNIYSQIIFARIDANPKIIIKNKEIRRYKNKIYFLNIKPIIKNTILFWHNPLFPLKLPYKLGKLEKNKKGISLPAPRYNELINIRFQYEEKILILGRDKKRKIKKIWQEKNIPPWLRNYIPLLFYNNNFISALGVFTINHKDIFRKKWEISWNNDILKNKKIDMIY